MERGTRWGMFHAATIDSFADMDSWSWKVMNFRKFELWPVIIGSNIDLGPKIIPPFASTRREQSAGLLTRAWPGGGRLTPPLPNIRDSSKTNSTIDVKLGRPSHATIWHRPWIFFWNPSETFWDMVDFVTSLHATFGRKLAKLRGSVEDAVFNENANKKHQKT